MVNAIEKRCLMSLVIENFLWKIVRLREKIRKAISPSIIKKNIRRGLGASKTGLTNINLSLSSACSANCIFCPIDQKRDGLRNMSISLVQKIINEIKSKEFTQKHNIEIVSVGENGDVFLHPEAIAIMRMIRKELPYVKIVVYTNFRVFTPEKIDIVLGEKLIDFVGCNIDGASAKNYKKVKKTDFDIVMKHLRYFITIRRQQWKDIPLLVSALTYHDYVNAVYKHFEKLPHKVVFEGDVNTIKDDFNDIKDFIMPLLKHPKDKFLRTLPIAWAERAMSSVASYKDYTCPQLSRIRKEAFIDPRGIWYACCFDGLTELHLGDVNKEFLAEIFQSDKRKEFILRLEKRQFKDIGGPCSSVDCCQRLEI